MKRQINWIVCISDGRAHEYKVGNVIFTVFSEFEPMKDEIGKHDQKPLRKKYQKRLRRFDR